MKQKDTPTDTPNPAELDAELVGEIGAGLIGTSPPPDVAERMRSRVLASVDALPSRPAVPAPVSRAGLPLGLQTEAANEGDWFEFGPGVHKKVLHVDETRRTEAYLLRLDPGAQVPRHYHVDDELCCVLEGGFRIGDLDLAAGDYHFAPRGSWHELAVSEAGALLYLQGALAA